MLLPGALAVAVLGAGLFSIVREVALAGGVCAAAERQERAGLREAVLGTLPVDAVRDVAVQSETEDPCQDVRTTLSARWHRTSGTAAVKLLEKGGWASRTTTNGRIVLSRDDDRDSEIVVDRDGLVASWRLDGDT